MSPYHIILRILWVAEEPTDTHCANLGKRRRKKTGDMIGQCLHTLWGSPLGPYEAGRQVAELSLGHGNRGFQMLQLLLMGFEGPACADQ